MRSDEADLAVIYTSVGGTLGMRTTNLKPGLRAFWMNPGTDERTPAAPAEEGAIRRFETPDAEDWVLVLG